MFLSSLCFIVVVISSWQQCPQLNCAVNQSLCDVDISVAGRSVCLAITGATYLTVSFVQTLMLGSGSEVVD